MVTNQFLHRGAIRFFSIHSKSKKYIQIACSNYESVPLFRSRQSVSVAPVYLRQKQSVVVSHQVLEKNSLNRNSSNHSSDFLHMERFVLSTFY